MELILTFPLLVAGGVVILAGFCAWAWLTGRDLS